MIRHEHGGSQTVQQGFLPDVGIGIVDEHTGIDVAVGIDVEVSAAPGNAPAHIFAVVLEVHGKQGLGGADFPDAVVHRFPLLRIGHQRRDSIIAHGHIVEVPDELCAPLYQLVDELIGADGVQVLAGIAGGDAEGQALLSKDGHSPEHLMVHAVSAAAIGGHFKTFQADGGDEVLHPQHIVRKCLVDEGSVGKREELAVRMLLTQGDDVLASHHGFAPGVDVHIDAQLLTLLDNGVDLI